MVGLQYGIIVAASWTHSMLAVRSSGVLIHSNYMPTLAVPFHTYGDIIKLS
jgi:hypothetical protein